MQFCVIVRKTSVIKITFFGYLLKAAATVNEVKLFIKQNPVKISTGPGAAAATGLVSNKGVNTQGEYIAAV